MTTWVYGFESVAQAEQRFDDDWQAVRGLLGGKGANLGDMTRIWGAGASWLHHHHRGLQRLPRRGLDLPRRPPRAGRRRARRSKADRQAFGDPDNPLLVSCRSGAKFSMPGMMDTVLNIGLNDDGRRRPHRTAPTTSTSCTTPTAASCRCSARSCSASATNHSRRVLARYRTTERGRGRRPPPTTSASHGRIQAIVRTVLGSPIPR